jgi:hypothetical protein
MPMLSDAELKPLMKQLARVLGLNLTDERVDADLAAYKGHLAANEKIRTVPLAMEAEPFVRLERTRRAGGAGRPGGAR